MNDIKTFSNDTIGTHFSLNDQFVETTWTLLNMTGILLEDTWALQEITGDEDLLLNDMDLLEDTSNVVSPATWTTVTTSATPVVPSTTTTPKVTPTPKTTTTPKKVSPAWGLSTQEKREMDQLLDGFGN